MPSSRHAWMMRRAISPRLAISIFLNITVHAVTDVGHEARRQDTWLTGVTSQRFDRDQALAILHGLPVLDVRLDELTLRLGGDLVHELHGLDDTEHLALADLLPDVHEGLRVGFGRSIERANNRRLDDGE